MEGCLKSHFSHFRNKVEKTTLRDLILKRFLEPKLAQDHEKVVSKSLQKSTRFFIRFFIDVGSILDPKGDPQILYFSSFFILAVALGPSWLQEGVQSAPRHLRRSIFQEFCTILGSILEDFLKMFQQKLKIFEHISNTRTHEHTNKDTNTNKQHTNKPSPICRGQNREAT